MHPFRRMPEILSKHPELVIEVLERQGAACGDGVAPKILTSCPPEKFCSLAGGELCVFGPGELAAMTQLEQDEVCAGAAARTAQPPDDREPTRDAQVSALVVIAAVLAGVALSAMRHRQLHRLPRHRAHA